MAFERGVLEAAGVPLDDVLLINQPVRVETLVSATPMLSMPQYVSPRIADTWHRIGRRLEEMADAGPTPQRIFCGRVRQTRWCNNQDEVQQAFREAGFEVVYPETMPLPEQAAMFRAADVVAGYAGSALFTLAFCETPKRVIIVSHESYTANNEYLIAGVVGHQVDVLWSVPDKLHFSSSYTFDFEREGKHLARVLADLGPG